MSVKMRKVLVSLLCLVMLVGLLPTAVYAAANIDSADIAVTHPAHLENPEAYVQVYGNCRVDTTYNSSGHKNGLRWKDVATGVYMNATDTFVGGKKYELSVALISADGYAFSSASTAVTVNGDPAELAVQSNINKAKATIVFTADNLYVNFVNITGLDAPKAGETADHSVSVQENTCEIYPYTKDHVSNGVFWYDNTEKAYVMPNEKFEVGHKYIANVYVQAKNGYEFPQNTRGTVDGKNCTVVRNTDKLVQAIMEYPALESNAHKHTPSAWRTTGAYHYKACTTCGDFLDQEDHKAGPAATETEPQKCTVCGYVIAPAKNHKHSLTKVSKVEATCIKEGVAEHYTCDGCSDVFADSEGKTKLAETAIAPLGHKTSDEWKVDENNHWRICSACNETLIETKMAHDMENGKCTTCGYDGTLPSASPDTDGGDASKDDGKADGGILWLRIVLGALVAAGGAVVVIVLLKKKKQP